MVCSWQQEFHPKVNFNSYLLLSRLDTRYRLFNNQKYFAGDSLVLKQDESIDNINNKWLSLGKISLEYTVDSRHYLDYGLFFKYNNLDYNKITGIRRELSENVVSEDRFDNHLSITQSMEFHDKLNDKHTFSTSLSYNFVQNKPTDMWRSETPFLKKILSFQQLPQYKVRQDKNTKLNILSVALKHYWEVDNLNHTTLGLQSKTQDEYVGVFKNLSDGAMYNLSNDSLGYSFNYHFLDYYLGVDYKFKRKKLMTKLSLYQHVYGYRFNDDFSKKVVNAMFLPSVNMEYTISSTRRLTFDYRLKPRFQNPQKMIEAYWLKSFYSLEKGNVTLSEEKHHNLLLTYSDYNLYKKMSFRVSLGYTIRDNETVSNYHFDKSHHYLTYLINQNLQQNVLGNVNYKKGFNSYTVRLKSMLSYADFENYLDHQPNKFNRVSNNMLFSLGKTFNKKHELILGLNLKSINHLKQPNYVTLRHFVEGMVAHRAVSFKTDLGFNRVRKNKLNLTSYWEGSMAITYKNNKPFGFEFSITNLFDNYKLVQNSFDNILLTETNTFIMPRLFLFKVFYKL